MGRRSNKTKAELAAMESELESIGFKFTKEPLKKFCRRKIKHIPSRQGKNHRPSSKLFESGSAGRATHVGTAPQGKLKQTLTQILRKRVEDPIVAAAIVDTMIKLAIEMNNVPALELLWERVEGKVTEKHEITTPGVTLLFRPYQPPAVAGSDSPAVEGQTIHITEKTLPCPIERFVPPPPELPPLDLKLPQPKTEEANPDG